MLGARATGRPSKDLCRLRLRRPGERMAQRLNRAAAIAAPGTGARTSLRAQLKNVAIPDTAQAKAAKTLQIATVLLAVELSFTNWTSGRVSTETFGFVGSARVPQPIRPSNTSGGGLTVDAPYQ